jgi:hypothetical protein
MYEILGKRDGQNDRASWREGVWKRCGEMGDVGGGKSTSFAAAIWVSRDPRTERVRC